jgi:cation:H+ antiporter
LEGIMSDIVLFIAGLLLLVLGAEGLVRGASRIASALGISPLVIGLTVVAFGTSSPELAVSVKSAIAGQADLALGNVIGSNILNVLLILGASAVIVPLVVSQRLVRFDVPVMIVLSLMTLLLSLDGVIGLADGILLLIGLVVYIWYLVHGSRRQNATESDEFAKEFGAPARTPMEWVFNIVLVLGGLALLVLGSDWFTSSAVSFARLLGISEMIIGLTLVALGTSLPELVTSVIAAIRGERDIAVGNIVGSNIFNIMGVLGVAGILAPAGVGVTDAVLAFDMPVMIVVAFACLPIFFTGGDISRKEGLMLLAYYIAYVLYLFLAATQHDALAGFSAVMLYFAIPLTLVTLLVVSLHELRKRRTNSRLKD